MKAERQDDRGDTEDAEGREEPTGALPAGWVQQQLRDVVSISGGKTPSTNNDAFWVNGTIPWVSPKDMKSDYISDTMDHLNKIVFSAAGMPQIECGAVLVVVRSGILQHSLPIAITATPLTINQDIKALQPNSRLTPRFLAYYLRAQAQPILRTATKAGTTVQSIETDKLFDYPIPLPPLPEQERIAARLDLLLGKLKAARKRLDAVPELVKRFRKSVLAEAVSGRLTEEWREEHAGELPTAEELLAQVRKERREAWEQAELEKMRTKGNVPKDEEWKNGYPLPAIEDIPGWEKSIQNWAWIRIDEASVFTSSGSRNWADLYAPSGAVFLRISNLQHDSISLRNHNFKYVDISNASEGLRTSLIAGDLIISITADLGMVLVVPEGLGEAYISQHLAVVRLVPNVSSSFLGFAVASPNIGQAQINEMNKGMTKAGLTLIDVKNINFPLPSLPEQKEIVRRVDELFAYADALEARVAEARKLAERLEPSILAKAFRGELSRQIPEEEAEWEMKLAEIERAAGELAKRAKPGRKPAAPRDEAGGAAKRPRGRPRKN